jgi:hypothetical protein
LRGQITGGDGLVFLSKAPGYFWIQGGDVVVTFARDAAAATRTTCWSEPDVVVTG